MHTIAQLIDSSRLITRPLILFFKSANMAVGKGSKDGTALRRLRLHFARIELQREPKYEFRAAEVFEHSDGGNVRRPLCTRLDLHCGFLAHARRLTLLVHHWKGKQYPKSLAQRIQTSLPLSLAVHKTSHAGTDIARSRPVPTFPAFAPCFPRISPDENTAWRAVISDPALRGLGGRSVAS